MYSIADYVHMINDDVRTGQYIKALQSVVKNDSIVMDIGTGSGLFALMSCYFGAKRVYALEPDDSIQIAQELAHENGYDNRINFIQDFSSKITLPEKVDIIISDLRGVLPLYNDHINSIIDARQRHLTDNGILLPQQDTLWAAIVNSQSLYHDYFSICKNDNFNIAINSAYKHIRNIPIKNYSEDEKTIVRPQSWAILNYYTIEQPDVSGELKWEIEYDTVAHGIRIWFDCNLIGNIGFNTSPDNRKTVYRNLFLPWLHEVNLEKGDTVGVSLKSSLVSCDYVYQWNTLIYQNNDPEKIKAEFNQSGFYGIPLSLLKLHKRSSDYKPEVNEDGVIDYQILEMIHQGKILKDIAQRMCEEFPHKFSNWQKALAYVGDLSIKYSK